MLKPENHEHRAALAGAGRAFVRFDAFLARGFLYSLEQPTEIRRTTQVDAVYLGIVVVFFALCFGMVRLFEQI